MPQRPQACSILAESLLNRGLAVRYLGDRNPLLDSPNLLEFRSRVGEISCINARMLRVGRLSSGGRLPEVGGRSLAHLASE